MNNALATPWEKIKGALFHCFPHHLLSRATYWATRKRSFLVTPAIKAFIKHFKVNMADAEYEDALHYSTFNEFFTRKLKQDARPIDTDVRSIICPCDGVISTCGPIENDTLIQAKNKNFSLADFCTPESHYLNQFKNGYYYTIYLSPRDYHRVHIPCDARLLEMTYVPGRLFSVAPYAAKTIDKLFARNERVIPVFSINQGYMAVAMVGAVNVAAIEMSWAGLITPPHKSSTSHYHYEKDPNPTKLKKGDYMGTFNMGSTVVLLFSEKSIKPLSTLTSEMPVKMGQAIGSYI